MACPVCFFRDSYQRALKARTFGIDRFELKLAGYKDLYLGELKSLTSLRECDCYNLYDNDSLCLWIDQFLSDISRNIELIESTFEKINSCYTKFISENQRSAINHLYSFLESSSLINRKVAPSDLVTTLFRARPKNKFDPKSINEFYHVPFSKRHRVASQRFSIPGLPLLYLGSSVLTVEKELEAKESGDLEYAAFVLSYSHIYNFKIFSLTNNINSLLENNLPEIMEADINYPYSGDANISYGPRFKQEIQANILLQICTFPTEFKCSFIPEYVIPQMLTTALQEKGFNGLNFPSTKCFDSLKDNHRFSSHHLNFVIFTKYHADKDRDDDLLSRFFTFTLNKHPNIYTDTVLNAIKEVCTINRRTEINNTDYVMPLVRAKLQIEYLKNSRINGVSYFDTDTGKTELSLYLDMVNTMHSKVAARVA